MTTSNQDAKIRQPNLGAPTASRPRIPEGYGIPKSKKGLLPWSHVTERMAAARTYWVCTVSPQRRPHTTPVDGLWLDDQLYFGGSPETRRHRYLVANPAVSVHLDSGIDVIILQGDAYELHAVEPTLALRLVEASTTKYGYAPKPEDYSAGGTFVFRPHEVFAWTKFPKDATRWIFRSAF